MTNRRSKTSLHHGEQVSWKRISLQKQNTKVKSSTSNMSTPTYQTCNSQQNFRKSLEKRKNLCNKSFKRKTLDLAKVLSSVKHSSVKSNPIFFQIYQKVISLFFYLENTQKLFRAFHPVYPLHSPFSCKHHRKKFYPPAKMAGKHPAIISELEKAFNRALAIPNMIPSSSLPQESWNAIFSVGELTLAIKILGKPTHPTHVLEEMIREVWENPRIQSFRQIPSRNGNSVFLVQFHSFQILEDVIRKTTRTIKGMEPEMAAPLEDSQLATGVAAMLADGEVQIPAGRTTEELEDHRIFSGLEPLDSRIPLIESAVAELQLGPLVVSCDKIEKNGQPEQVQSEEESVTVGENNTKHFTFTAVGPSKVKMVHSTQAHILWHLKVGGPGKGKSFGAVRSRPQVSSPLKTVCSSPSLLISSESVNSPSNENSPNYSPATPSFEPFVLAADEESVVKQPPNSDELRLAAQRWRESRPESQQTPEEASPSVFESQMMSNAHPGEKRGVSSAFTPLEVQIGAGPETQKRARLEESSED